MPSIEPDSVVVARDDHVATTVDGEVILLNKETGTYQGLEGVGPEVWEAIQEPTSVESVAETIAAEYDVSPGRCERDVREFVEALAAEGLARIDEEGTG